MIVSPPPPLKKGEPPSSWAKAILDSLDCASVWEIVSARVRSGPPSSRSTRAPAGGNSPSGPPLQILVELGSEAQVSTVLRAAPRLRKVQALRETFLRPVRPAQERAALKELYSLVTSLRERETDGKTSYRVDHQRFKVTKWVSGELVKGWSPPPVPPSGEPPAQPVASSSSQLVDKASSSTSAGQLAAEQTSPHTPAPIHITDWAMETERSQDLDGYSTPREEPTPEEEPRPN